MSAARSRCVCVCAVVHVVTRSFCARVEASASESLGGATADGRTPTLRVDTLAPQEGSTCTRSPHCHCCLTLPLTFPGGGGLLPRVRGLHCSARSLCKTPHLSSLLNLGLRRTEKTQKLPVRRKKCMWPTPFKTCRRSLHPASSPITPMRKASGGVRPNAATTYPEQSDSLRLLINLTMSFDKPSTP